MLSPDLTLRTLMFLFAAYILLDSAYAYIASGKIRGANRDSRSLPVDVLIGLAAGVFTLIFVAVAAVVVLYLFAALAIWTGAMALRAYFELRSDGFKDWLLVIRCVSLIVFGVLLALFPVTSVTAIVMLIGLFAVIHGMTELALAYRLYKWHSGQGALHAR